MRPALLRSAAEPPPGEIRTGQYVAAFARDQASVCEAQRLRYRIFNEELGEGLATAVATGRDEDRFDAQCHHLLVRERESGEVVGTYRMQTAAMAGAGAGFYSGTEFQLGIAPLGLLDPVVEVGRACVAAKHRTGPVLWLLWRGIARYLAWSEATALMGCCSVQGLDRGVAFGLRAALAARGALHPAVDLPPQEALRCAPAEAQEAPPLPALLESYLSLGARVAGGPALDHDFGVTDFLVLLDVADVHPRLWRNMSDPGAWVTA